MSLTLLFIYCIGHMLTFLHASQSPQELNPRLKRWEESEATAALIKLNDILSRLGRNTFKEIIMHVLTHWFFLQESTLCVFAPHTPSRTFIGRAIPKLQGNTVGEPSFSH